MTTEQSRYVHLENALNKQIDGWGAKIESIEQWSQHVGPDVKRRLLGDAAAERLFMTDIDVAYMYYSGISQMLEHALWDRAYDATRHALGVEVCPPPTTSHYTRDPMGIVNNMPLSKLVYLWRDTDNMMVQAPREAIWNELVRHAALLPVKSAAACIHFVVRNYNRGRICPPDELIQLASLCGEYEPVVLGHEFTRILKTPEEKESGSARLARLREYLAAGIQPAPTALKPALEIVFAGEEHEYNAARSWSSRKNTKRKRRKYQRREDFVQFGRIAAMAVRAGGVLNEQDLIGMAGVSAQAPLDKQVRALASAMRLEGYADDAQALLSMLLAMEIA